MTSLHQRLYEGPHRQELHPDVPYRPHMTLGANTDMLGQLPIKAELTNLNVVKLEADVLQTLKSMNLALGDFVAN